MPAGSALFVSPIESDIEALPGVLMFEIMDLCC
jgi:hypothetical protein